MGKATPTGFRDDNDAQCFVTDAMERLITEARQFGVSMTFAHPRMSQLSASKADALSSVGSTIMFRVNGNDA
jgi:hypothetical protein